MRAALKQDHVTLENNLKTLQQYLSTVRLCFSFYHYLVFFNYGYCVSCLVKVTAKVPQHFLTSVSS